MIRTKSILMRRLLALMAPVLILFAIALGLFWRSPETSHGAGSASLDSLAAIVNFSFAGGCSPGAIATPVNSVGAQGVSATQDFPKVIDVTTPVGGCISRAGCPDTIMIGNERFSYANVSALTLSYINAGPAGPVTPFLVPARNLPDPPPNLLNCAPQGDFSGNFATSPWCPSQGCQIYIDDELFTYSSVSSTSGFQITARSGSDKDHQQGSLIRAAYKLELLDRAIPKYPAAAYTTPTPIFAAHAPGDSVHSPKTYNTCRVLLSQQAPPLGDVKATSACFFIQEPGYSEALCATPASPPAPTPCFWPPGGMPSDYQRAPVQHWSSTNVQDNGDNTTSVTLIRNDLPSQCLPYLSNPTGALLWAKMQMTLTLLKSGKSYSSTTGPNNTFVIKVYKTNQCDDVGPMTPVPTPAITLSDATPNVAASVAPAYFFKCVADVQSTDAHALCYINSPSITNNKPAAGAANCGPALLKFCGDGIFAAPGCTQASQLPVPASCLALPAATPTRHDCAGLGTSPDPQVPCDVSQYQYLHVDKSMSLVVTNDSGAKTELRYGCAEDPNLHQPLGAVYVDSMTIDPRTGSGSATIWPNLTQGACTNAALNHSPPAGTSSQVPVQVTLERQKSDGANAVVCDGVPGHPQPVPGTTNNCRNGDSFGTCFDPANTANAYCHDSDGDGCWDKDELQAPVGTQIPLDLAKFGGMRDPQNPYDYVDMPIASNRHKIRVDDVTYVVNHYRHNMNTLPAPSPVYDPKADHTVLPGNNTGETWHLGPPDGQITVADVVAVVNQYRHDCN